MSKEWSEAYCSTTQHRVPRDSALFQEYLKSQRELGFSSSEAADHFSEAVADATQELWEDVTA